MQLTGTPGPELLAKIKSDEVRYVNTHSTHSVKYIVDSRQYKVYIGSTQCTT